MSETQGSNGATEPPVDPEPAETPAAIDVTPAPALPDIADDVEHRLHPSHVTLNRWIAWIVTANAALLLGVGSIVLLVTGFPLWADGAIFLTGTLVTLALGMSSHFWPPLEHRYTSYRVGRLGIEIRRGVVWRQTIMVPRSRVQHTDVSQGPMERRLGLATLHMFTAGTEHSKVELAGLSHEVAMRIRNHLVVGGEDDAV